MIRRTAILTNIALAVLLLSAASAGAEVENCETEPRPACFGIESVSAALSTTQAGAHPNLKFDVGVKQNPQSVKNPADLYDSYAATRDIRFVVAPGLIGDPNVIGSVQQCSVQQLFAAAQFNETNGCPNGSQVGISTVSAYELTKKFHEPVYMMEPPGGDVVARMGLIAGIYPTIIDFRVRSDSDYALVAEVTNAPAIARLVKLESTFWGVPAAKAHDKERCTPLEAFNGCVNSPSRPPGGNERPFLTNPTRCGISLSVGANASSWVEPELDPEKEVQAPFPTITGCEHLPFGPSLTSIPTSHRISSPSGLDMTIKLPAFGVNTLEPSQTRYMRIDLPVGLAVNTSSADGLDTCSANQVKFEENVASECPDAAKLAATEFDIPVLERKLRGAIYLREQEPGHPYRIWIVADDLGLHVKLPGELELDKETGQIHSLVVGTPQTEGIPQAPLREVKLLFKSGFRSPLATPPACGTYYTHYEFVPWSGGPPATGDVPMQIDEGCNEGGGFSPKLSAGSTDSQGGAFSPFTVTIAREDLEQNIAALNLVLPRGLAASFAGIPHCEGAAAETGACPPESRIGKVVAAVGVGPAPLWVPQAGKRPTAVYLGGPYKGAPTSIISVVPKQAGPFDFGEEVVRSAVFVDPATAQATAQADPLPQFVEGTPLFYRTINVQLDRPNFALNPTSCRRTETVANLTSTEGKNASPLSSYAATGCSRLDFKPSISFRLRGKTRRGGFPALKATVKMPSGGANIAGSTVILPYALFVEQNHFVSICTKVQFAADECPAGSIYGFAKAKTPLIDGTLEGPVYLRSTTEPDKYKLPDMVVALQGPSSLPIEIDLLGHVDSVRRRAHGESISLLRNTFEVVPDAPVSEFTLELPGGHHSLLVNSANFCKGVQRATTRFTAQNGKVVTLRPAMQVNCGKTPQRHKRGR